MSAELTPTREALLRVARSLPPAAQILAGICELLHDVNTDLDQIADEIRMDAALAARVIRVSNSVVYGGAGSVASVEEAVGRVGFAEIVRLVGTATVNRIADRELRCYHVPVDLLRESLLMHGLASEALGERCGINRNTAYVGGLLRGIGAMVLDRFAGERLGAHLTFDPIEFDTYDVWENVRFGITAPRVTTMALDDWKFPDEIVNAIDLHLDPPSAVTEESERLANVINLAGAIAVYHARALPGEVRHWTRTPQKLAAIGLDEEQYSQIAQQASQLFDQQRQALY
jgi:HD-like signal output (HDOD) protein